MPAPTATIIITTIPTQQAGVPFLVSGTYVLDSATWDDQLFYTDNSGAHIPIGARPVGLELSSWSFSHTGMPAGTHTVSIRDPLTGAIATSNSFSVIAAKSITPTTVSGSPLAGAAFTFAGTLTGYTTAPTLTYQILGPLGPNAKSTTAAPVTGVTTSAWSMQLTLATAGNYSISVSDGAISASLPVTIAPATTAHVITPTLPASVSAGATFAFTGTLSGYATPPTLTYVINNGAPIPITGVTSTGWSMQIVAPTAAGGYNLVVADGTTSGQATLTVTSQAKVITPTAPSGVRAGQSFTFQGLLSGYATIPALTYTLSGGSPVAMTGVSVTGWAMTVTIPTAGSYTVTVSDGTNTSPPASFTVTAANVVLRDFSLNPGMDGSFWILPQQSSANFITSGPLITALRGGTPTINTTGNYSPPFVRGTAADPKVTVTDGTHTEVIRVPIGTQVEGPSSPYDQSIGGTDATRPYLVWSISGATIYDKNNNVISAINGDGCTIRGTYGFAVQDGAGLIMVDKVTGAPGDNNSIGGIQSYELSRIAADPNYVIGHMLAFQLDVSNQASSAGPIWPLQLTDTSSGGSSTPYAGPIPQGITAMIPASVRMPTGKNRAFKALWDVCQQKGMINYNFGQVGGVNIAVYDTSGQYTSLVNDMVAAWPEVVQSLCILNYAEGVSGAQYSLATTKGAIPGSTSVYPEEPPLDLSPTGGKNVAPSTFGAWYPSGYNATPTNSTTSGGGATFIITPNAPTNVVVATAFTFSGSLSGYSTAPALTYALNGAAPVAMTGVTAQGWSMSLTVQTSGATTVVVTDSANVASGSVSFQVSSTRPTSNPVAWNPSTAAGGITLSNNNYTATATGSATSYSTPQGVLATTALSTSQPVLWEVTFSAVTQNAAVGVASAAAALSTTGGMGADANSIGFYPSTGTGSQPAQTVYSSGNQLTAGNGVSAGAGAVITCVVNGTNIYFSDAAMRSTSGVAWNNSTTANPASNSGGFSFAGIGTPYYAAFATGEAGAVAVMNDGTQPLSAFATSFLAANPSVVTISGAASATPAKSIMPGTPSGVVTGAPFTFTGTLSGYSSVPTLTYQLNGGTVTALGGVTQTGWSATLVTQVSGSNVITVSDGTVNASVNFSTGAASGGGTRVAAPLTGSVTTGTWNLGLRYSQANSPSGLGYMVYNVLPPAQYNPNVVYPVLCVGHPDNDGGGSNYPKDPGSFVTGQAYGAQYSIDSMYNTVAFRTAFPCFVVAPQCDQTLGDSNPNGNFGGYADSQMSGWNEQAVAGIINALIGQYPIDPGRRYHIGYSLGGIGTLAQLVDNNQYNGPALKLWTAGITYSDQLYRPNTPNSNVFSRMASVPLLTISTTSDNVPSSYDEPAWQTYTGNSNYPGKSQYDSGGMAAVRAGTTQYYYINYGSANPATTFMPMNALGGDGDKAYQWLFSQVFGGTGPTITGATFTPAATVIANSAKGTVAGSLLAGSSGGALTGITYTLSSTTNFSVSGANVLFNANTVAQGTYPLTVSVTAANASNSPQSYTITIQVAASSTTTYTPDHVVVCIMENHSYSDIIGNTAEAPFINSLLSQGCNFTNYFAVAHPSEPNYFAMFSGSTQGVTDDGTYNFPNTPSLCGQLVAAGRSFTGYYETASPQKHNPWQSFGDASAHGANFSTFPSSFASLPTVAYVVPDQNDDMHDGSISQADSWLSTNMGAYITWAKTNNSLFILVWDEDDSSSNNQVAFIVVGQHVTAGSTFSTAVNHYSQLQMIEDFYGLGHLSNAVNAAKITLPGITVPVPGTTGPAASGSFINVDFTNTTAFFSGQVQTVSPYVWGFSTGAMGNSNCADMTDATFRASTAKLRPTLIRFNANLGLVDGGTSASMTNFINNYQSCFSSNVRIVMGINFSDSTTAVTNFANAMISAGLPIHYWELGNETDGSVTTAAYITKFNAVAAALHAVDASYLLGGPVWSWWDAGDGTNPLQTFAAGVGSNLGFCSFHSYGTQSGSGPINYGLTYTDVTSVRQALNAAGISSSVPIGLLEYNQNGTPPGDVTQAQSFGAVYAALMVIGSLNQDRNFTMGGLWDIEQDSYYGAISNNSTGFGNIDPQGWTLGVAGQTVTGTRVGPASPVVGSQNIAVLPTVNGTNFGVMIVNYSTSSSYSGQVALSHLPGYSTGSGTITRTITSTGSAPVTTTLAVANGIVASDTIPAQSVVIYTQGTQSTSAGTFKVSGGKVLKPDGTVFKGLGISFWDNQLTSGITNAACQPMLTLFPGVNMVRLARVDSTFWSPDTYAQQINWMTAKGIVVVIENHRTSNGQTGGGGQGSIYTGALLQQEQNWYSALATYFKDNTYVWFGTCNEPPADNQLAALWQWQQTTYNTIRATGSNAIVEMEQGNPYLQGSNSGLSNTIFSQMHNIVFGPHYYSWIWGGNGSTVVPQSTIYSSSIGSANSQYGGIVQQVQTLQALTSADGVVPVGCYEFGPSTTGTGVDASGMNCVKAVIQAVHNGDLFCFMAWLWGNIGDDNLQDASGNVQSPYGTTIAAAIQAG